MKKFLGFLVETVKLFLEETGLRCSSCGSWFQSQKSMHREVRRDSNEDGDARLLNIHEHICACGHRVSKRAEEAPYFGTDQAA